MNFILESNASAHDFLKWSREVRRALSAKGVSETIEVSATQLSKASARKDAVAKTVIIEKLHDELSRNIDDDMLSAQQFFQLVEAKVSRCQCHEWVAQPPVERIHGLTVSEDGRSHALSQIGSWCRFWRLWKGPNDNPPTYASIVVCLDKCDFGEFELKLREAESVINNNKQLPGEIPIV